MRRKKKRKRKSRAWLLWRFAIILSFCLNIFGGYKAVEKKIARLPLIRREALKLAWDGVKWRYWRP